MYSPSHSGVPPPLQPPHNEYRGEYPPPPLHSQPLHHDGYYQTSRMGPPSVHHIYGYPPHPPPSYYMPHHALNIPTQTGPTIEERDEQINIQNRQRINDEIDNNIPNSSIRDGSNKSNTRLTPLPRARFKKERFAAYDARSYLPESTHACSYSLVVSQQPLRARMCGFGEKDRRPIDPPPIVQLIINDSNGDTDNSMIQNPFFVLHVTLWSEDGREERNVISSPPKATRVLMGSLVSSPAVLKNPSGQLGCYFCFPDLSIRTEGKYTLKFALMKLGSEDRLIDTTTEVIATAFSEPFTVYSAKKFPGMTESTELSKTFAKQGLKIPIRNDVRPRKVIDDGNGNGNLNGNRNENENGN